MNAEVAYLHNLTPADVFDLTNPVDELGRLQAQIASLTEIANRYKAEILAAGVGAHDGTLFRATVSETADRETPDPKAMEAKLRELGVDGRWFAHNMKTTKGFRSVRLSARK